MLRWNTKNNKPTSIISRYTLETYEEKGAFMGGLIGSMCSEDDLLTKQKPNKQNCINMYVRCRGL
uniref:Uncharacterized protein n=1 Tax=Arion vulgaris TaxID=1028688 RepID=A0A0B6ZI65_9EUPU